MTKTGYQLATLLLVAATSAAWGAKKAGPTATIIVQKGYDKGSGLGTGTAQFYDTASADQCKGRKRIARFSWIAGAEKSRQVVAGQTLFVTAQTNRYTATGVSSTGYGFSANLDTARCENRVSFTPETGEAYTILQKVEIGKSCAISVVAKSTSAPPADLVELKPLEC